MRLLVTGGLGFIGSNFINYYLKTHPSDEIINLDKETYASDKWNLDQSLLHENYQFVKGDICNSRVVNEVATSCDIVVNFAAESHVDNSILDPRPFIDTNFFGTYTLLEAAKKYGLRFHHVSTDEVFGSLDLHDKSKFNENTRYDPRNPYSASKAAADFLVRSYCNTYGIKATISNCGNNFGPNQHPEKLIPKTIIMAKMNRKIPIYGSGNNVRDWVYVEDHCRAIDMILRKGETGETYLISSKNEYSNRDLISILLEKINASRSLMEFVRDRPGHDLKYSIDPSFIENKLGWRPLYSFSNALELTISHYENNMSHYISKMDRE